MRKPEKQKEILDSEWKRRYTRLHNKVKREERVYHEAVLSELRAMHNKGGATPSEIKSAAERLKLKVA